MALPYERTDVRTHATKTRANNIQSSIAREFSHLWNRLWNQTRPYWRYVTSDDLRLRPWAQLSRILGPWWRGRWRS